MKTILFSFIAALILSGCAAKQEAQIPLKGTAQKVELKNEIREKLGLPIPQAVSFQEVERVQIPRPETPNREDEKIIRGMMLPYTEGTIKWGASYVYDVLKERKWKYENEVKPPVNSTMIGGIN